MRFQGEILPLKPTEQGPPSKLGRLQAYCCRCTMAGGRIEPPDIWRMCNVFL